MPAFIPDHLLQAIGILILAVALIRATHMSKREWAVTMLAGVFVLLGLFQRMHAAEKMPPAVSTAVAVPIHPLVIESLRVKQLSSSVAKWLVASAATRPPTAPGTETWLALTFDPQKLQAFGMTAVDALAAIKANGFVPEATPPAGAAPGQCVFRLKPTDADLAPRLLDLVIKMVDGAPVRLSNVAALSIVALPASAPASRPADSAPAPATR